MPNPWFRMYHEFSTDPKVQSMPEEMQRRLVMLFCDKAAGRIFSEKLVTFHWRLSDVALAETKAIFIENGFIDSAWTILNWNKRQYVSDSSADRTRRYRDRLKRHGNVTVTPPDTETETETEQKKQKTLARSAHVSEKIEEIYLAYPKHVGKAAALKAIEKALRSIDDPTPAETLLKIVQFFAQTPAGNKGEYTPHPATWFNRKRYLDDPKEWNR